MMATMRAAAWANPAKRFEFLGTTILLVAFASQLTLSRIADHKRATWDLAAQDYATSRLLALSELNLYFTTGQSTQRYDPTWLQRSAEDDANGLATRLAVGPRSRRERAADIAQVLTAPQSVHDIESYNQFRAALTPYEIRASGTTGFELTLLGRWETFSLWLYGGAYMFGTFLLLRGLWLEGHK